MRRPREAISAPMLTTAVGIDARLETNIRAVVARDDRLRVVAKELRSQRWTFVGFVRLDWLQLNMERLEPVCRISGCATAARRLDDRHLYILMVSAGQRRDCSPRTRLIFTAWRMGHDTCSHEQI